MLCHIQNFEYALCTRQPISNHQLPFSHKMLTAGKSKNNSIKTQEFFNLLDSQIDMLLNAKAKATSITEVPSEKFIFLHLQTTLQKLHCLVTSDSDIACNLLISSNPKGTNRVPCCQNQEKQKDLLPFNSEKQPHVYSIQNLYQTLTVKQTI